jgi:hypothetical protein
VGCEDLALDDREVDFDLVDPGRVDRGVDHDRVREPRREPIGRGLATV